MHELFADWYRKINPNPTEEKLKKRWKSVEVLLRETSIPFWLELTRVYLGLDFQPSTREKLVAALKEHDATFPKRNNEFELQVLSGAAIASLVSRSDDGSLVPALAVLIAACHGEGGVGPLSDVFDLCREHIVEVGFEARARLDAVNVDIKRISNRRTKLPTPGIVSLDKLKNQNDWGTTNSNFEKVEGAFKKIGGGFNSLLSALNTSIDEIRESIRELLDDRQRIEVISEENQVLWWLYSEASRDLSLPLTKLGPGACLIVGKELAELASILPGPPTSRAFLNRALLNSSIKPSEKLPLVGVVESTPRDWREAWVGKYDLSRVRDFAVVAFATSSSVSTAQGDDWIKAFTHNSVVEKSVELSALNWAEQTYYETLLLRELQRRNIE